MKMRDLQGGNVRFANSPLEGSCGVIPPCVFHPHHVFMLKLSKSGHDDANASTPLSSRSTRHAIRSLHHMRLLNAKHGCKSSMPSLREFERRGTSPEDDCSKASCSMV